MPKEDTQFKPGAEWKGNKKGRPKGDTLKEFVRKRFLLLTNEQKIKFLSGLPKEVIWKMAEGNPSEESKIKHSGEIKAQSDINIEKLAENLSKELKKKKI